MADPLDIKQAVHDIVIAALPDFTVTWNFGVKNPPRVWCYLGNLTWPDGEWQTNRSRQYDMMLPIVLNAIKPRMSAEEMERWLADQVKTVTAAFDADSTLRATGVISWGLTPRVLGSQPHPDGIEGQAVLELTTTYR